MAMDLSGNPSALDISVHHPDVLQERKTDVSIKHQRVSEFLEDTQYDALLLGMPEGFSWFTSGGNSSHGLSSHGYAAVFISRDKRQIIASNVESGRLFQEEIGGLGFELIEYAWQDSLASVYERLFGNRHVASDTGVEGTTGVNDQLKHLRLVLTPLERQRLRELGRDISYSIETTARVVPQGVTESVIAGEVARRLIKRSVTPCEILVAGDDRSAQYRRPVFSDHVIQRYGMIAVYGQRNGLCAGATRCFSFGEPEEVYRKRFELSCMVDATSIYYSRPGESFQTIFEQVKRVFKKYNRPNEWTICDQGGVMGTHPTELVATPDSAFHLASNMAVSWCPTVGSARSQDTVLIDDQGFEIVTRVHRWPNNKVKVQGCNVTRPGLLIR